MAPDDAPPPGATGSALLPLLHVPTFVVLSLAWMLFLGIGVAVWLLASGTVDFTDPMSILDATSTGLLTTVQILGLGALAVVLALVVPPEVPPIASVPRSRADLAFRLGPALGFRVPAWQWVAASLLAASAMWTLASWLATELTELFPSWPSVVSQISEMIVNADTVGFLALSFAIVVTAPLMEELIFRGYLWRVLEVGLGRGAAFVGSTLLFALYHMDPMHVVALLPTAAYLGWLRLRSGSLFPCILAHFVNNGLALALSMFPTDPSAELPVWVAFGGYAVGIGILAMAELITRWRRA